MTRAVHPWVLLHGFTGRASSFDAMLDAYTGSAPVSVFDLPGHGDTPLFPPLDKAIDDIHRRFPSTPVRLFGYSMGGRLALSIALRHPQSVALLVIAGGNPGIDSTEERATRKTIDEQWIALLREDGIETFVSHWEEQPLLTPHRAAPSMVAEQRQLRLGHDAEALAGSLQLFSPAFMPSMWSEIGKLTMPSTWIAGALDHKYCGLMKRAASAAPAGRYQEIENAGHALLIDAPRDLAAILSTIA